MFAVTSVTLPIRDFSELLAYGRFDERQRRILYGFLAIKIGYGGQTAVATELNVSPITVRKAIKELNQNVASLDSSGDRDQESRETSSSQAVVQDLPPERIRRPGGGRKSLVLKNPLLLKTLEELLSEQTYGDPERVILWTTLSLRKIKDYLKGKGFTVSHTVVGELLEKLGYSKQCNQKMLQVNEPHPDRDAQFRFINDKSKLFLSIGDPVISIDCKKKEKIGNFKNEGQEYRKKGEGRQVGDHDFSILKAAPYGVYVVNDNTAFVNVGTDGDTGEFAAESIWRWWDAVGSKTFKGKNKIFITCDGGGSNGCRVRLWKLALAKLSERTGLEIHVSHFPPGTSKWNKIEHRLFCYISKSWAGQPLVDIKTVVKLIGSTTTTKGLKVTCVADENTYPRGIKVTDEEFAKINIEPIGDFGQWNYIIRGFKGQ